MKKLVAAAMVVLFGAFFACISWADVVPPTTNDWFDASFTALTADTPVTQGDTLGITRGAGSWTAVPATGTAVIAADADAGGGATCLSLNAPGEELALTPAAFGSASDIETVSVQVKAEAIDELPDLDGNVQGSFTVYLDENDELSARGWTSAGWTALTSAPVDSLTNAWVTVYVDFATTGGVRVVRYSVKPASGSLSVLSDANGTTWFTAATNATVVSSVSLSGVGSCRAINGDALAFSGVARVGMDYYATIEDAIAAALVSGEMATLLADATWTPAATGTYHIDVNGHALVINGASTTINGTTYTISRLTNYYWIGGESTEWANGSNWSHTPGGAAANEYPDSQSHSTSDYAYFPEGASLTLNNFVNVRSIFTDGTLTLAGNGSGGVRTTSNNNTAPFTMGGTGLVRLAGVSINVPYATSAAGSETQISNALEIVAGTTNFFRLCTGSSRYASLHLRGDSSGSGCLVIWSNTDSANYPTYFYGDASAFTGTLADHREEDEYAARINVMSAAALSATATYNLTATYNAAGQNYVLRAGGTGTTYRMGALNGEVHFDGNNNSKSTQYNGYTLEIGGKSEDCSFGGTLARSGYASYTKKVGTADMTFTGSQIPNITIENGTYIIGSTTALPNTMIFTGGAFSVAEGVSVDPVSKFASDSTAAVVFDDRGLDNTWAVSLIDSRVPYGFTKKGSGTLTLTTVPTHTTKTTVEDGILVVPQGTTIAELSCEGGKLTVPFAGTEDDTAVLTVTALAEGTTVEDLEEAVAVAGTDTSVESGEGGYVVKATRTPQTFTWTGAVDSDWSNGGNWAVGGVAATTAPLAIDTVLFASAGASVSLATGATVARIVVDAATTFSIPDNSPLRAPMVCGDGVITLVEGFFAPVNSSSSSCVISNDIVFAEGYDGRAYLAGADYQSISLRGNVSGTGTLTIYEGSHRNAGIQFYGSAEGFSGAIVVECSNQYRRDTTKFLTTNAVNANVAYSFWGNDSNSDTFETGEGESEKYWRLGSVDGRIYMNTTKATGHTIEVGALNTDFSCGGTIGHKNSGGVWAYQNTVRKVGTGTFTSSINYAGTYDVAEGNLLLETNALPITAIAFNGGTLVLTNAFNETDLDIAATIKNSASAVAIDTGDDDYTFATAIAASNAGGLTKKGAGTLTLSAAPLYTGLTTVEEGTLVVPSGSDITYNPFSAGTLSGITPTKFGYPAGTTLTGAETTKSFTGSLDISNVAAIDVSGATLTSGQPYVIASADAITGYTRTGLKDIPLTLPEGADGSKWKLRVRTIDGKRCLCLADFDMGSMLILF